MKMYNALSCSAPSNLLLLRFLLAIRLPVRRGREPDRVKLDPVVIHHEVQLMEVNQLVHALR